MSRDLQKMGSAESMRISSISRIIIILRKRLSRWFWRLRNPEVPGISDAERNSGRPLRGIAPNPYWETLWEILTERITRGSERESSLPFVKLAGFLVDL